MCRHAFRSLVFSDLEASEDIFLIFLIYFSQQKYPKLKKIKLESTFFLLLIFIKLPNCVRKYRENHMLSSKEYLLIK